MEHLHIYMARIVLCIARWIEHLFIVKYHLVFFVYMFVFEFSSGLVLRGHCEREKISWLYFINVAQNVL